MVIICCASLCGNFHVIKRGDIKIGVIDENSRPYTAFVDNGAIIDDVLDSKLLDYATNGYFSDLYKTSIHAIYYAVYSLFTLGKRSLINEDLITSFIMAHFNASSGIFEDDYSNRYLAIDFSGIYAFYPWTSLLEINCYAVLALDLLGGLDLINIQDFIDFIWSCYNPVTSGFIGQPYDSNLHPKFKMSTMDNTFYAVETLDLLMPNWIGYTTERNDIVTFVNSLQNARGNFDNDVDDTFSTLSSYEDNMLAAYYCVKTLDKFGMADTIDTTDFYFYLDDNYISPSEYPDVEGDDFFVFENPTVLVNKSNLIATAMGVELSEISGFTGHDKDEAVQYLLNNRNGIGNWNDGVEYGYHELTYTFQIIRSLYEVNTLSQLSSGEINVIANAIMLYYDGYSGFCLISPDYMSVELINCLINSFESKNRINELDINGIYNAEMNALQMSNNRPYFTYATGMDASYTGFKTFPIEFNNLGLKTKVKIIDSLMSLKNNFFVLESMEKMFKLDDLDAECGLEDFIDEIVACQFLDNGYEGFGGFFAVHMFNAYPMDFKEKNIFLEYSYYALKTLELLTNYMGTGSVLNVSFDQSALYMYISSNIIETIDVIYYDPEYSSDTDIILKNTYYMAYLLNILNMYTLDDQKILNFIDQNIDYTNLKNIYYCWKISETLHLEYEFDINASISLIQEVYDPLLNELYSTTEKNIIIQELLWMVCDMAKNDRIRITPNYDPAVSLGGWNNISCTLGNLVLNNFGTYASVRFESPQLGVEFLTQSNNFFYKNVHVPKDASNFPLIDGNITVYNVADKVAWKYISFLITNSDSPIDNSPQNPNSAIINAIPLIISFLAIPGCAIVVSSKHKTKSKLRLNQS